MQVSEIDNVKIYNLSVGKALPDVSSAYCFLTYKTEKLIKLISLYLVFLTLL